MYSYLVHIRLIYFAFLSLIENSELFSCGFGHIYQILGKLRATCDFELVWIHFALILTWLGTFSAHIGTFGYILGTYRHVWAHFAHISGRLGEADGAWCVCPDRLMTLWIHSRMDTRCDSPVMAGNGTQLRFTESRQRLRRASTNWRRGESFPQTGDVRRRITQADFGKPAGRRVAGFWGDGGGGKGAPAVLGRHRVSRFCAQSQMNSPLRDRRGQSLLMLERKFDSETQSNQRSWIG